MSDHAQQPASTPRVPESSQNEPDADLTLTDEITRQQLPDDEEATLADGELTAVQNGPVNPEEPKELGEPTAPMLIQAAATIQIPARPAEGEQEDTLLAVPVK